MKKALLLMMLAASTAASAADYVFRLKNTLGFQRTDETVEVAVPEGADLSASALRDEQGQVVPFIALTTSHCASFAV